MRKLRISVGSFVFIASFEESKASKTCDAFCALLPLRSHTLQALWSGEAVWIPLPQSDLVVDYENATAFPGKGELLLYPGNGTEHGLLFPYGATHFKTKYGQIAGNHFLTIVSGYEHLQDLGHLILWKGVQDISLELLLSS